MRSYILSLIVLVTCTCALNAQCPTSSRPGVHVVQPNETLYGIARKNNISLNQLSSWNNLNLNNVLTVCTELKVVDPLTSSVPTSFNTTTERPPATTTTTAPPTANTFVNYRKQPGTRHTVQPGETFAGLAELYGYTESRFREINPIGVGEELTPGSVILSTDCACQRVSFQDGSGLGYNANPSTTAFNPTPSITTTNPNPTFTNPTTTNPTTTNPTTTTPSPFSTDNTSGSYMKPEEQSMVNEINLLRNDPRNYVRHVLDYVNTQRRTGGFPISQSVVDELVAELNSTPRLSTLRASQCVYNIARQHGEDQKPLGDINHRGRDGLSAYERITRACPELTDATENLVAGPSTVRESVIILLIDEGIPIAVIAKHYSIQSGM